MSIRGVSPLLPGKGLMVATFAFRCRAQWGALVLRAALAPARGLRRFVRRTVLRNVRKVRKVLTAWALELV